MIHVSIHDVSPACPSELEAALALCAEHGAKPALLVVPCFHGEWPLERYPAFTERLRALRGEGHEILLHGFHHRAPPGAARGVRGYVAQRLLSNGEAEFAAISPDEAARRLDDGKALLDSLGLSPCGFVAPAWQMKRWLLPMLAARGLPYAEDHVCVYDPVARTSRRSLVLNFASRTPARLVTSAAFVRAAAPLSRLLPTRIALHPGDMKSPVLVREARRVLSRARERLTDTVRELL